MMHNAATTITPTTTGLAQRAELRRRAYLLAGMAGVDPRTALGALEHGLGRVRTLAARALLASAAETLGIELP